MAPRLLPRLDREHIPLADLSAFDRGKRSLTVQRLVLGQINLNGRVSASIHSRTRETDATASSPAPADETVRFGRIERRPIHSKEIRGSGGSSGNSGTSLARARQVVRERMRATGSCVTCRMGRHARPRTRSARTLHPEPGSTAPAAPTAWTRPAPRVARTARASTVRARVSLAAPPAPVCENASTPRTCASHQGRGVKKDDHEAVFLYFRACTSGSSTACEHLADARDRGRGTPKDPAAEQRARKWKSCATDGTSDGKTVRNCPKICGSAGP